MGTRGVCGHVELSVQSWYCMPWLWVQSGSGPLQRPTLVDTKIATWYFSAFLSARHLLDPPQVLQDGTHSWTVREVSNTGLTCGWIRWSRHRRGGAGPASTVDSPSAASAAQQKQLTRSSGGCRRPHRGWFGTERSATTSRTVDETTRRVQSSATGSDGQLPAALRAECGGSLQAPVLSAAAREPAARTCRSSLSPASETSASPPPEEPRRPGAESRRGERRASAAAPPDAAPRQLASQTGPPSAGPAPPGAPPAKPPACRRTPPPTPV